MQRIAYLFTCCSIFLQYIYTVGWLV